MKSMHLIHQLVPLCIPLFLMWGVWVNPLLADEFQNQREHRLAYKAQQELEQEDYQSCVELLQPYLAQHEQPAVTLFVLCAQAQSELGQEGAALGTYSQAAELYPENALILQNYAVTSYQVGRLQQAARLFERASAQGESDESEELLYQAAAVWFEAKEYSRAGQVMQSLLDRTKKPKTEWVELLVYSLVHERKWNQAESRLQHVVSQRPTDWKLWQLLAHVRSQQDDMLGAASALELAYGLNEPGKKKWRDLASMYAAAGVPMMGVKAMRKGLGDDPDAQHCWRMGQLYAQALRIDQAVKWMDRALVGKDKPDWHLDKAHLLYTHERFAQCREAARQAAETGCEKKGEAWMLVGYAAWQEQDWHGARQAFTRAENTEDTASRAASCLQTVERILKSERKIRLADVQTKLPLAAESQFDRVRN
ncbi:MAG: tetratricopeptide repeat protein [Thermodesulfobacteriota bacterium]